MDPAAFQQAFLQMQEQMNLQNQNQQQQQQQHAADMIGLQNALALALANAAAAAAAAPVPHAVPPPMARGPRIGEIEKYDGTVSLGAWESKMRQLFDFYAVGGDIERVRYAAMAFGGPALTWWELHPNPPATWVLLVEGLRALPTGHLGGDGAHEAARAVAEGIGARLRLRIQRARRARTDDGCRYAAPSIHSRTQ
jgi:hypothetical protein